MWELGSEVLQAAGFGALILLALLGGAAVAIHALFGQNQKLNEKLQEIQEKRVDDARRVTEEVVRHVAAVNNTVEKLETSLDVLIELSRNRR